MSNRFAPITLGRPTRVVESDSFVFTETLHRPRTTLGAHSHEHAAISFIIEGTRRYRFEQTVFDCTAGSAIVVPAGAPHSSRFAAERARGLMLELRAAKAPTELLDTPQRLRADAKPRFDAILHEMSNPDDLTPLALESLALELIVTEARSAIATRVVPRWLLRVREELHDSFKSPPPLATLSAHAGVDRSRLTREFRRHFGTSIGDYVRSLRTEHAWQLVACSKRPLSDIASECGFADQSHLTRAFRRAYAITPGRLRNGCDPTVPFVPRAFNT